MLLENGGCDQLARAISRLDCGFCFENLRGNWLYTLTTIVYNYS